MPIQVITNTLKNLEGTITITKSTDPSQVLNLYANLHTVNIKTDTLNFVPGLTYNIHAWLMNDFATEPLNIYFCSSIPSNTIGCKKVGVLGAYTSQTYITNYGPLQIAPQMPADAQLILNDVFALVYNSDTGKYNGMLVIKLIPLGVVGVSPLLPKVKINDLR